MRKLVEEATCVAQKSSCTVQSCANSQGQHNRQTGTSSLEARSILTFSVAALLCVEMRGGWIFGFF
ncbi:MAG: hypothetical protein JGK30_27180 [Microcoleus sp. PH2017_40_RAT_O_B]|uniref:hypothetical protein n=1 Tax=unclassified Microcoleus TaxID=2642155 RepID=UPI001D6346E8|nr:MULTISPECIES: hypothetical protein [unclassified Microcoleus]MCC3439929.1 hypothetical protein [Microcoleus sp. PH2017_05_CCC_O_A]MCC3575167.1 hypothetical protein [Microcoleus sp. PH2017_34_RAT_O_A]MCC3613055.1 hypothetical protein [Microcoleus sp. PH2017_40_RAT_O_B]